MAGITQILRTMPPKLDLPWGTPTKPTIWSCKLISAPKDAPLGGGVLYYEIKSPVLNVKNGYRSLMIKFAWEGIHPVIVDVYCTDNGVNLVSLLKIPQYFTLEEALVSVWRKINWHKTNQEVFFNTKVASKKKTKAKKRKPNPKSIDRYVKEYAEQKGYDSAEDIPSNEKGKAFAIAWSRYCSKRPGSPRCKKDKGTYFPKRPNIAKGIAKSMEEKRRKRTKKKASTFNVVDRHIKVASESPSTLRDLFYGDYRSIKLNWGMPAKPNLWKTELVYRENNTSQGHRRLYLVNSPLLLNPIELSFDLQEIENVAGQVKEYVKVAVNLPHVKSDSFNHFVESMPVPEADFDSMMANIWSKILREAKGKLHTKVLKPGVRVASESPSTLRDFFKQRPEAFELAWGTPAKKNMWKVKIEQETQNETYYRVKSPALNLDLSIKVFIYRAISEVEVRLITKDNQIGKTLFFNRFDDKHPNLDLPFDTFMEEVWRGVAHEAEQHPLKGGTPILKPNVKVASASGRYGYTKKVQKDCELAVSQLKKYCKALCSKQKSKGNKHLEFYRAHAEKSGSPFVKAFVQCHKDIYNEALGKIASSMYGYEERTVKRCLSSINDLQIRSAMLINKLLARKTSDSDKIKAYLSEHIEQTGCVWSTCLYSCL